MWQLHPLVFILVALGLFLMAIAVFAMVGRDYRMKGRGEEQHLASVFGQESSDYCARTPRFIGLPKR